MEEVQSGYIVSDGHKQIDYSSELVAYLGFAVSKLVQVEVSTFLDLLDLEDTSQIVFAEVGKLEFSLRHFLQCDAPTTDVHIDQRKAMAKTIVTTMAHHITRLIKLRALDIAENIWKP